MPTFPAVLDLDAKRAERAAWRAAQREGHGETLPIRWKGEIIATLDAEFPLDILAPFKDVNVDIALLVRQAMDLIAAENVDVQLATADMIVSVIAANPELPHELLAAIEKSARLLLGNGGYDKLLAGRPSREDLGALISHGMEWYGVSLGEASEPSPSSIDGETSPPISNPDTGSTSEVSGNGQAPPASSESVDSSN